MITSLDPEYLNTLELKRGNTSLPEISRRLINWINKEYEVGAINVYYDRIIPDNRPRVQIIFENHPDVSKFRENGIGNYLPQKQSAISNQYAELVNELRLHDKFPTHNVLICYSEFSNIYKSNIYNSVPKSHFEKLFEKYKSEYIWRIQINGSGLIVFFFNNLDKKNSKYDFMIESLKKEYFSILKLFDEFGYLNDTWVSRESQEDFDNIYDGSWFNWSRDH